MTSPMFGSTLLDRKKHVDTKTILSQFATRVGYKSVDVKNVEKLSKHFFRTFLIVTLAM